MRMKRQIQPAAIVAMVLLTTILVAVAGPASSSAANSKRESTAEEESQIRAVLASQTAAWNRGDIRAFMDGYWNSNATAFVGAGGVIHGWNTLLKRYQRLYPNQDAMGQLSFTNLEVHIECPNAAYVIGEYQLQQPNNTLSGVFTLEFQKFLEGWRIVVDHTTGYPAKP